MNENLLSLGELELESHSRARVLNHNNEDSKDEAIIHKNTEAMERTTSSGNEIRTMSEEHGDSDGIRAGDDAEWQAADEDWKARALEMAAKAGFTEAGLLKWRAHIKALPDKPGATRLFANPYKDGRMETIASPLFTSDTLGCYIDITHMSPGLYHVVFCITIGVGDAGDSPTMPAIRLIINDYEVDFTPRKEQLESASRTTVLRIRFPYTVPIFTSKGTVVFVETEKKANQAVLLHYLELQDTAFDPDLTDIQIDISKAPTPLKVLDVCASDKKNVAFVSKKPVAIMNHAVSTSGRYAVTLSRTDEHGRIDLWDLRETETLDFSAAKLVACGSFEWQTMDGGVVSYGVSVSNAGHVVIFQELLQHHAVFVPYTFNPLFTPVGSAKEFGLVRIGTHIAHASALLPDNHAVELFEGLQGFGKFVSSAFGADDGFLFCDGLSVCFYTANGGWKLVYKRDLTESVDFSSARVLVDGASAGLFAWTGDPGVISIWTTDAASLLATAPLADRHISCISFSEDGLRMMAIGICDRYVFLARNGVLLITDKSKWGSFVQTALPIVSFVLGGSQIMCHNDGSVVDSQTLLSTGAFYRTRPRDWKEYRVMPGTGGALVTASHGSKLMVFAVADIVENACLLGCRQKCLPEQYAMDTEKDSYEVGPDLRFKVRVDGSPGEKVMVVEAQLPNQDPKIVLSMNFYRQPQTFFLRTRPFLVVMNRGNIYIWKLPVHTVDSMDLVLYLRTFSDFKVKLTCEHEEYLTFSNPSLDTSLTFGLHNPITLELAEDVFGSFRKLIEWYQLPSTDDTIRNAIAMYLCRHLNHYPDPQRLWLSVVYCLCEAWEISNHSDLESLLRHLLYLGPVRWVPLDSYPKGSNPLSILLKEAHTQPKVIGAINVIIDYCVEKAHEERNPVYLSPMFDTLDDLLRLFPDVADRFFRNVVYLRVGSRPFIIKNHSIAHPPTLRRFWIRNSQALQETVKPILQVQYSAEKSDPKKDYFTQEVFVASFDMLWAKRETEVLGSEDASVVKAVDSWVRMLLALVLVSVGFRKSSSVPRRDFKTFQLDNPAMEALIQYKWNTFAFAAWLARMVFQMVFYILVVTAALVQVYAQEKEMLLGVFVAIIAMAGIFLWLEFLQFWDDWQRGQVYISPYNALDLIVFMLPMAASIHQIVNISRGDDHGNKSALSFSIVIILLHLLSEFRVSQVVCKYVTIVLRILNEIQVFFIVFAAGILTFALATLHLLHGCPINGCESGLEGFPTHFFGAVSSTYFIMGGRYDPVNQFLNEERWDIHIMMMIYFFFTVILMLNVLIALISIGFNKGDESWRNVWLENRLRYVESAENLTHYVPGFREKFDWFPKEIYYTASSTQITAYCKTYDLKDWTTILATPALNPPPGDPSPKNELESNISKDVQTLVQEMRENAWTANQRAWTLEQQVGQLRFEMQEQVRVADERVEKLKVEMQEQAFVAEERFERLQRDMSEVLGLIREGLKG